MSVWNPAQTFITTTTGPAKLRISINFVSFPLTYSCVTFEIKKPDNAVAGAVLQAWLPAPVKGYAAVVAAPLALKKLRATEGLHSI